MRNSNISNFIFVNEPIEINITKERHFWYAYLLKTIIIIPLICPLCGKKGINAYDNDTLINPVIGRCINSKCGKKFFLRENSFLSHFEKTPASIVFIILKEWLIEEKNGNQIYNILKKNN